MAIQYNSNYDGTTPFSDTCTQFFLVSNQVEATLVPGTPESRYQATFGYNSESNIFVGLNSTPSIPPSPSSITTPYCELKPLKKYVKGGDIIRMITPDDTAYASISLMSI